MKLKFIGSHSNSLDLPRRLPALVSMASLVALPFMGAAQEVIYQEDFNSDGEGSRYTVQGGDVYEVDRIADELGLADQSGPIYWARNTEVSFVGVPGPTAARRVLMSWHHTIPEDAVGSEVLELFDSVVKWLVSEESGATILFSPPENPANPGDVVLAERLRNQGYEVIDDDESGDLPDPDTVDLVIKSSSGSTNPSRFATYQVPVLTYAATDHDDLLVSSIGETATGEITEITMTDSGHPAAGDLKGGLTGVTGEQSFDLPGTQLAPDATVIANFTRRIGPSAGSLADVDGMVDGSIPSDKTQGSLEAADLALVDDAAGGYHPYDLDVPGGPSGAFATVAKGTLDVTEAGTYSFALGADDGGRLRIDLAGDGLSEADDVIVVDSTGAFRETFADVEFPSTGEYAFEWVAFNDSGAFGSEVSVTIDPGGGNTGPVDILDWDLLGDVSAISTVTLSGELDVTTYVPTEESMETSPFLVVMEGPDDGGLVFGGGPFLPFEGEGFFAGAGLNKFDGVTDKLVTLKPIDVRGKENLQLRAAFAATFLDFETSDFLDIWIDPDDDGPEEFSQLVHFTAPSGNDKFLDDSSTNPSNPTRLGTEFKEVVYDLPVGATDLVIELRALTTWWNEIVGIDNIRITSGAAPPAELGVKLREGKVEISWEGPGTLEESSNLTDWSDVPDAPSSPYAAVPNSAPARFYRLRN